MLVMGSLQIDWPRTHYGEAREHQSADRQSSEWRSSPELPKEATRATRPRSTPKDDKLSSSYLCLARGEIWRR